MGEKVESKRTIKQKFQGKLILEQRKRIVLEEEFQEKLNSEQGKRIELELQIEKSKKGTRKANIKSKERNVELVSRNWIRN